MAGPIQSSIHDKLVDAFAPSVLEVINESHGHNVPAGSESHFKVVVVSDKFDGQRSLQRHRSVNEVLQAELAGQIHALSIVAYTPAQWADKGGATPASPPCRGGSKADR